MKFWGFHPLGSRRKRPGENTPNDRAVVAIGNIKVARATKAVLQAEALFHGCFVQASRCGRLRWKISNYWGEKVPL